MATEIFYVKYKLDTNDSKKKLEIINTNGN